MKKFKLINKFVLAFVLCFSIFMFAGCTDIFENAVNSSESQAQSQNVKFVEKSAYQVAVENGFTGTQADWLNSLKGKSAYEIALDNGFVGTENEWLASLKGNNGISTSGDDTAVINTLLQSVVSFFCSTTAESSSGSAGSGVIFSLEKSTGEAYFLTNYHVVYNETAKSVYPSITMRLYGSSKTITGTFVGGSSFYDIAIVKATDEILINSPAHAISLCKDDETVVGQTAIAIGNAEGNGLSVTKGIVCVDSEEISLQAVDADTTNSNRVLRIDTPVNRGNSGGGLFNSKGELIGIVNAKIIDSNVEGIGYAIPVSLVSKVANNILYYNTNESLNCVKKPILGVTIQMAEFKSVYDQQKAITRVIGTVTVYEVGDTSAFYGKLEVGDIIKSVKVQSGDETLITRTYKMVDFMLTCKVGDTVTIKVDRNGTEYSFDAIITAEMMTTL